MTEMPVLLDSLDGLLAALKASVRNESGKKHFCPPVIGGDDIKEIAEQLRRFVALARKVPTLWSEINRRASFEKTARKELSLAVPPSQKKTKKASKHASPSAPTVVALNYSTLAGNLPADLLEEDCYGCCWLRDSEGKSLKQLASVYGRQAAFGMLESIYVALGHLRPWMEQSVKGAKKPGRPPKFVDPKEAAIRHAYASTGRIKATVEKLTLGTLNKLSAAKRVQRIVNKDKRAKSRKLKEAAKQKSS